MRLSVKKLINAPGERVDFRFDADLSHVDFGGACPARQPVSVVGQVENIAGMLLLTMQVQTVLDTACDRCGKPLKKPVDFSVQYMLAEELQEQENDDILLLEGDEVDLDELVRVEFILHMDSKTICSENCKGLCPRCGADLNLGPCSCKKETDPRLAVLAKLLDKND